MTQAFRKILTSVILTGLLINASGQTSMIKIADSLYMKSDYKGALPYYEKILKDDSKNALVWNRFGYSSQQTGNLDVALKAYASSLDNNPPTGLKTAVESRLARIYSLKNDIVKSFDWLGKAIGDGYNNLNELDTENDFTNLRKDTQYGIYRKKIYEASYPCSKEAKRRQFDFWIGEWDVFNPAGIQVGRSVVQNVSGECMILENWSSTYSPYTGKSINFYNKDTDRWEQHWVGSAGDVGINPNGEFSDGAMRFSRETKDSNGKAILNHFYFYHLDSDRVRQHLETSSDNGVTWKTSFDYTYVRKKN